MKKTITFKDSSKPSFENRLNELGMTLDQYIKWLIKNDMGIDA